METPLFRKEKPSLKREGKFSWLRPFDFGSFLKSFKSDRNKIITFTIGYVTLIIIVFLIVTHTPNLKGQIETSPDRKIRASVDFEK